MSIMISYIFVIFCSFYVFVNAYDSCPESNSKNPAVTLKDSILCRYDYFVRPVADHQKAVNVSFGMRLKYFNYDVYTSTLSLDTWLILGWADEHLKWNPADFGNISWTHIHTNDIWTPDIALYNGANLGEDPLLIGLTRCVVTSKGLVRCVPPSHTNALCIPDLSRYPFDQHICTLNIGSWVHKGEEIDWILPKKAVNTMELASNGEWKLEVVKVFKNVGKYECCPKDTFPSIQITFKIKRLSGAHTASVIIPTLVTVMITFCLLWLSPTDKERLILCYVNLFVQFLQLQNISWMFPLKGENIPLLIIFQRDSLLLAMFALIFTMIFRSLMQKRTTTPGYILVVIKSPVGRLGQETIFTESPSTSNNCVREGDDREEIIKPASNTTEEWTTFARILDRLLFISYVIAYIIMMLSFLP